MRDKDKNALLRICLSILLPTTVDRDSSWKGRPPSPWLPSYVVQLRIQRQSMAVRVMTPELLNCSRLLTIILKNFMFTDVSEMILISGRSLIPDLLWPGQHMPGSGMSVQAMNPPSIELTASLLSQKQLLWAIRLSNIRQGSFVQVIGPN